MDSQSYLALNAWLQTSDKNYMAGRLLWLNHFISGDCNLLWLSSEQIIKILILQKEIDKHSGDSSDLTELHDNLNKQGMKLGHNVEKLIEKLNKEYPDLDISKFQETLKKLQEYFYRRYVVPCLSGCLPNTLPVVCRENQS